MADLPPYTNTDEPSDRESSNTPSRAKILAWAIPIVLILVLVGLHLTGVVGPGS